MLTSEASNKIAQRARAVVKGQRWAYRLGQRQGALGSLIVALAAAGVGLVIGAIIGTEAGSGSESRNVPQELSSNADLALRSDALMPAATFGPARRVKVEPKFGPPPSLVEPAASLVDSEQKIVSDFEAAYEARLPREELLIDEVPVDEVPVDEVPVDEVPVDEVGEAGGEEVIYEYPVSDDALTTAVVPKQPEAIVPEQPEAVVPEQPEAVDQLWQQHAVAVPGLNGQPVIALVIDDLGLNRINSRRAIGLPAPLTLSFLTYAEGLEGMTMRARDAGHELLVHVPMEPRDLRWDPGPNALLVGLPEDELERRLDWALGRFDGYVGINNHMGSRFTTSLLGMAQVMAALKSRGLLFLDSLTAGSSVGISLAASLNVPHVGRDIFIDNTPEDAGSIWTQLRKLERVAQRRGEAIGIAHPHSATLEVLSEWIPAVASRGFALVPLTTVVERARESTVDTEPQ